MLPLGNSGKSPVDVDEQMDYDRQVRELAFDQRAKPKDRTKTEEELALEEKETLEKAEKQRRRRMLGEDGEDDEDGKNHGKRKRERGGDDLEDDFVQEEAWGGLGAGLGEIDINDEASEEDESGEEEDHDGSADDYDKTSDDENEDSGVEEINEENSASDTGSDSGDEFDEITTSRKSAELKPPGARGELPFTFPCPESHEEFLEIVEEVDEKDVPTVVQRIRTLHHPSLAPENKLRLQVPFSFDCYSCS
jgi:nucleolar protein 14